MGSRCSAIGVDSAADSWPPGNGLTANASSNDRNRRSRSAIAQPPSRQAAPGGAGRGQGSVDA